MGPTPAEPRAEPGVPGVDPADHAVRWLAVRLDVVDDRLRALSERITFIAERTADREATPAFRQHPAVAETGRRRPSATPTSRRDSGMQASRFAARDAAAEDDNPAHGGLRPPPLPGELSGFAGSEVGTGPETPTAGPALEGTLSQLSLGTLLSLLELERRSGRLCLEARGRRVVLSLRQGSVVDSQVDGVRSTAVDAIRSACSFSRAAFSFRDDPEQNGADRPRSANALMLEVLREKDETARVG